ncbi:hypothetical protein [Parasphingorhabdus sp.]|uniref:hypothetical protein n=1 Tax=Parasphingorhabdus sp. TaxID=2709688 RepID=UPI003C74DD44
MESYNSNLTRKRRLPEKPIGSGHDKRERIRELEEMQRSLAERIRTKERIVKDDRAAETG